MKNSNYLISPHDKIDFNENVHEAKKWGKDFNKKQEQKMNRDDHRAFNIFNMNWRQINQYLRQEKGILIKDQSILKQKGYDLKINDKIANFDKTLDKLQLGHTLYVYRRLDESFFEINKHLRDNGLIDNKLIEEIKYKYQNKIKKENSYMSTSLSKNPVGSHFNAENFPILMKIKLLPHVKAIYLSEISDHTEELELLIKRGYKLKYEKFSIINERQVQTALINVTISD